MINGELLKVMQKVAYGVCGRRVGNNSIQCNHSMQCTSCQKWVHKKCSGIRGSISRVTKVFL